MGDGAAVSPFAVRTSPNRSPPGSPGCAEPIRRRRRRPAAVAFSEAAAAPTPESSHSPGVLSAPLTLGISFSGCFSSSGSPRLSEGCSRASHRPKQAARGSGKTDRSGGGVSFRGRERERIELHLGMTEEPAERLCVRLKRQGEGCSGELCREGWLEQVCGFPSSGMKEVREGDPQARPLGGGLWRSLCRFRPEAGCWWCERGAPVEQGWKVRGRSCPGGMELMERGPLMLE
ncbi:uncharacterized protein LOC112532614 [Gallus gallus]|uniref:uncharacterized protein LOC112532614 n=1 Tax=Gallus gallus TaxID=9031 RepID=UPI001F00CD2A|nr:uncharacterized protein LOC112532614 [Gallus gallus]